MPTLLETEGFRFYFFSLEEGEPSHVHVRKGGGKAKFWLAPVSLAKARGLIRPELRRARELTEEHAAYFVQPIGIPIGISFCGRLTGGVGKSPAGAVWRAGEALEPLARACEAPAARYAATGSRGAKPGGQGPPLGLGQAGSGREVNPILPTLPTLRRARRRAGPPGRAGASPAAPGSGRDSPGSGPPQRLQTSGSV
ncbi:MAG TPA: DUF4160 domain-containing protein [Vicinamibacteria bacterium]